MDQEVLRKLKVNMILIRIIFGGLLFGITSFLAAMSLIVDPESNVQTAPGDLKTFQLAAPILMVITAGISIFLRKSLLAKVENELDPLKLIKSFTVTRIIQMALMDAAILFAIVCYVLTADIYFVLLSGIGILYFASLFPIQEKVIKQLKLDTPIGY